MGSDIPFPGSDVVPPAVSSIGIANEALVQPAIPPRGPEESPDSWHRPPASASGAPLGIDNSERPILASGPFASGSKGGRSAGV